MSIVWDAVADIGKRLRQLRGEESSGRRFSAMEPGVQPVDKGPGHDFGEWNEACSICACTRTDVDDAIVSRDACPGPCTTPRILVAAGGRFAQEHWQHPDGSRYVRIIARESAEDLAAFKAWRVGGMKGLDEHHKRVNSPVVVHPVLSKPPSDATLQMLRHVARAHQDHWDVALGADFTVQREILAADVQPKRGITGREPPYRSVTCDVQVRADEGRQFIRNDGVREVLVLAEGQHPIWLKPGQTCDVNGPGCPCSTCFRERAAATIYDRVLADAERSARDAEQLRSREWGEKFSVKLTDAERAMLTQGRPDLVPVSRGDGMSQRLTKMLPIHSFRRPPAGLSKQEQYISRGEWTLPSARLGLSFFTQNHSDKPITICTPRGDTVHLQPGES